MKIQLQLVVDIVQQTKLDIQEKLRNIMSLLVDIPRPGSGNTNDANTASRFFRQLNLAAILTAT